MLHVFSLAGPCRRYMISPWQKNGNVLDYVKAHDSTINYIRMVRVDPLVL